MSHVTASGAERLRVPLFADTANREKLKAELVSWLGTPWAHMAGTDGHQTALKGVGGDCKTILATAYADAGFIERLQFPAHGVAPGLLGDSDVESSIVKYLARYVERGEMLRLDARREPLWTGDVLTFRWGAREHHLGAALVMSYGERFVFHVPKPGTRFILSPLSEWFTHLRSAYRLLVAPKPGEGGEVAR